MNESDAIYSWQAVAVALINMIGAVIMAHYRERTNQIRIENGDDHSGKPRRRRKKSADRTFSKKGRGSKIDQTM